MAQNIDELVPLFIQRRRKGDSYRKIGLDLGVDWRTVKSRIEKAENDGDYEHWARVRQAADLKTLERHRSLLSLVCQGVERGISFNPLTSQLADPDELLKGVVETGLEHVFESMGTRGMDLEPPTTTSSVNGLVKPPKERLAEKSLASLMQHQPELEKQLAGWGESWKEVRKERDSLAEQGRNLYRQQGIEDGLAKTLGWATAQEALGKALDLPRLGYLGMEEEEGGSVRIVMTEGANQNKIVDGTKTEIGSIWIAREHVLGQLTHPERTEPIRTAYQNLLRIVVEITNQLDSILLKGYPEGICDLCEGTGVPPSKPTKRGVK